MRDTRLDSVNPEDDIILIRYRRTGQRAPVVEESFHIDDVLDAQVRIQQLVDEGTIGFVEVFDYLYSGTNDFEAFSDDDA